MLHVNRRNVVATVQPNQVLNVRRGAFSQNATASTSSSAEQTITASASTPDAQGLTPKNEIGTSSAGEDSQAKNGKTAISSLPPDIQAYIDELRKEAGKYRKEKQAAETAARQAEEKQLADQQEWQKLAEKRGQELEALKPVAAQYEEIKAAFEKMLAGKLELLPEDTRKLLEPVRATMTPVVFSQWLDTMLPTLTRKAPNLDGGAYSNGAGGKRQATKGDLKPVSY